MYAEKLKKRTLSPVAELFIDHIRTFARSMTTLSVGAEPSSSMTRPLIKMGVCGIVWVLLGWVGFVVVGGRVVVVGTLGVEPVVGDAPAPAPPVGAVAPAPPLP